MSFDEAVSGTDRSVSIKRGDKVEKLKVKIPAGVDNGSKVRVSGKGQPGFGGGKSGDLYLRVHVDTHPDFWREGCRYLHGNSNYDIRFRSWHEA